MATPPAVAWIEVSLRAAPADVEAIADVLSLFAPDGVSYEPVIRILDHADFAYEETDEPMLLRACLAAPFGVAVRRALRRRLGALPLSAPLGRLHYAPVVNNWAEEWKRFFHVLRAGRLVVRPSWEPYEAAPGELIIDLDPGAAFGTGQHETTRLCLGALDAQVTTGMRVLDVGTGSGILSIAAARLGASSVDAVDIDAEAVVVARENVERNGVDGIVRCAPGSIGDDWPWGPSPVADADLVVANISSSVLARLLPACAAALRPGGVFIGSGYIEDGAPGVEAAVRAAGLSIVDVASEAEWRCLVAVRPADGVGAGEAH
ncbi:MAG: 50S ribosomal protein L11 methyltransferase [Chloroflexi bacterium]|nr:MAG: 50S ribosomal protein L11 methyltransferase [Chloroflexota bacterium]